MEIVNCFKIFHSLRGLSFECSAHTFIKTFTIRTECPMDTIICVFGALNMLSGPKRVQVSVAIYCYICKFFVKNVYFQGEYFYLYHF